MVITLDGITGSGVLWKYIMHIICWGTYWQSMVDLGCFHAPYTPQLGFAKRTYVDIQDRPLDFPEEQQFFVKEDMVKYLESYKHHFQVAISSDSLEHLTHERGLALLDAMERCSDKQIIFTPLGPFGTTDDGHPDSHASSWRPDMLPEYLCIVFPNWHPELNMGAFFAIRCSDEENTRIFNEIKSKYVESRAD